MFVRCSLISISNYALYCALMKWKCVADDQGVCTLYCGSDGSCMGRQAILLQISKNDSLVHWSVCWFC